MDWSRDTTYYQVRTSFLRERTLTKILGRDKLRIKNSFLNCMSLAVLILKILKCSNKDWLVRKLRELRAEARHTHMWRKTILRRVISKSKGPEATNVYNVVCDEQRGNQCNRKKKKKVDTEWYQDYITLTGNGKKYGFDSRDDVKSWDGLSRDMTWYQDKN